MEESTAGKNGRREERVLHTNGARHVQEARLGSAPSASHSQCTSTCSSPSHVQICEHTQVPAGTQIKAPLSMLPVCEWLSQSTSQGCAGGNTQHYCRGSICTASPRPGLQVPRRPHELRTARTRPDEFSSNVSEQRALET